MPPVADRDIHDNRTARSNAVAAHFSFILNPAVPMFNRFSRVAGRIASIHGLFLFSFAMLGAQETSTTLGGYGEVQYVEPEGSPRGRLDVARFVLLIEHSFDENIALVSELEVEHTKIEGDEAGGEVALEQAYLRCRVGEQTSLRFGLVLIPAGIINETHEPPTFNGVRRPVLDHDVIPATWREIGAGIGGPIAAVDGLQYRAYLTSGLHHDGFSADEGIREGRYEGARATMDNIAFSGRLEYATEAARYGLWGYYGGSSDNNAVLGTGLLDAPVAAYGADVRYAIGDLQFRGVAAAVSIVDADKINAIRAADSLAPVGEIVAGAYGEVAYDLAPIVGTPEGSHLLPFARVEAINTQGSMPDGFTADDANNRLIVTAGVTYKPTYDTVFKIDWTFNDDKSPAKKPGALSAGIGYNF